ncbi:MAG: hypothetical protein ABGY75_22465, partial [Gemmataceae bacterium]
PAEGGTPTRRDLRRYEVGLALSVGELAWHLGPNGDPEGLVWLREELRKLNVLLRKNGLPEHHEPEVLPEIDRRGAWHSFPYSCTHHLRRAVAYARNAPDEFATIDREQEPSKDPYIDRELSVRMDCHLICHDDGSGFYVPIDFPEPLYADDVEELAGVILGSSQRLLAELIQAAPLLEIQLDMNGWLSDAEAANLRDEDSHRYGLERQVWFAFYEAARASVEYKTVITFG